MITRRALLQSASLLTLASPLLARAARAQAGAATEENWLEGIARQLRSEFKVPAVWLASAIDDNVNAVAVGVRKVGEETPATTEDLLTIASVSKPMAGLWIATLVDKGKLSYTSKALAVLPELASVCLPEHRDITLEQLLTHTAGLARDVVDLPANLAVEKYPAERIRQAKVLLATPSPEKSVGREFYSNNGLALAVAMAERASGEPYEVAAMRFFREELKLKSWGVWGNDAPNDSSQPWPHEMKSGAFTARDPRSIAFQFTRPGGSAHCTIADCARFGLMATNAQPDTNRVLKLSTWDTLLARVPKSQNTRGSFFLSPEKSSYDHSGSLTVTRSNLQVIPDWRVAVAVHTNANSPDLPARGTELVLDAIRRSYALADPPPLCRITLTDINTVDETWKNTIVPKLSDDKLRVRVNLRVEAPQRSGDLKTTLRVGSVTRTDNRFYGLQTGNHYLQFEFDTPKEKVSPAVITIDALGTAGNDSPQAARFESSLTLQ